MLGKSPLWGSWIQHESTFATFDHYKHTFVTCCYRKILALIRYARYAPHGLKAVFLTSCQCGLSPMLAIIGTQLARSPLVVWGGGVHSATLCTAMLHMPVFHIEEGSHILRLTILPPKMFRSFELLIQGSWQECYAHSLFSFVTRILTKFEGLSEGHRLLHSSALKIPQIFSFFLSLCSGWQCDTISTPRLCDCKLIHRINNTILLCIVQMVVASSFVDVFSFLYGKKKNIEYFWWQNLTVDCSDLTTVSCSSAV